MAKKRQEVAENMGGCNTCDESADCADVAAPAVPADATSAAKAEKPKKIVANHTFKLNIAREKVEGEKALPKQAAQIVDLVAAAGEAGIKREPLLLEMAKVIETRQPIDRILAFYIPKLVKEGKYLTMEG